MPNSAYTNTDDDFDSAPNTTPDTGTDLDVDTIAEALSAAELPDREVIAPRHDACGVLLPIFRVWMRDGYTAMYHARTAGEACHFAIESARTMILDAALTAREKRLATTVDGCQQIG